MCQDTLTEESIPIKDLPTYSVKILISLIALPIVAISCNLLSKNCKVPL